MTRIFIHNFLLQTETMNEIQNIKLHFVCNYDWKTLARIHKLKSNSDCNARGLSGLKVYQMGEGGRRGREERRRGGGKSRLHFLFIQPEEHEL